MKNNTTGNKKRGVIAVCAALGCLIVAGVGYGSWLISSTLTDQKKDVSVVAADIDQESITISEIALTSGYSSYVFGPKPQSEGGTVIKSSGDENQEEALEVRFTFNLSIGASLSNTYNITLNLATSNTLTATDTGYSDAEGANNKALDYAISQAYVVAPITPNSTTATTIATITGSTCTATSFAEGSQISASVEATTAESGASNTWIVSVSVSFAWGTYFNSVNPINATSEGLGDNSLANIISALTWIKSYLNSDTYTYTISGAEATTA